MLNNANSAVKITKQVLDDRVHCVYILAFMLWPGSINMFHPISFYVECQEVGRVEHVSEAVKPAFLYPAGSHLQYTTLCHFLDCQLCELLKSSSVFFLYH